VGVNNLIRGVSYLLFSVWGNTGSTWLICMTKSILLRKADAC